jgi:hypothetical protein
MQEGFSMNSKKAYQNAGVMKALMNGNSYDELKVINPGSAEPSVNELIKPNNSLAHKFVP